MRTRVFHLLVTAGLALNGAAQNFNNPYADQTGNPFEVPPPSSGGSYLGEYQIFLDDYFWNIDDYSAFVKIEAVGFPFTPQFLDAPDLSQRIMVMPDLDSYGYNAEPGPCQGWAWKSNNHGAFPDEERDMIRVANIDFSGGTSGSAGQWMADHCALTSAYWSEVAGYEHDCTLGDSRVILPHTALKHTIYLKDATGLVVDSISWVYDNTRGRMRSYPFCWNCPGQQQYYDLCFRPFALSDPGTPHQYDATSNSTWAGGTANYYARPWNAEEQPDILWPTDETQEFEPLSGNSGIVHPAPFSLLEAPLYNNDASATQATNWT